jgi:hypothetical protein
VTFGLAEAAELAARAGSGEPPEVAEPPEIAGSHEAAEPTEAAEVVEAM